MKTIMVIEDDTDIQDILKDSLEMEGYNVLTAMNGQEGLDKLFENNHPHLILLDMMMPVMDGLTFAQRIEKEREFDDIPIVMVTAFSEKASQVKRAKGLIPKPFTIDNLLKTVREKSRA